MRGGERIRGYPVLLERTGRNYGAVVPELPGCVATGPTRDETLRVMYEAMELHIRGIEEDGLPVPRPTAG
jgi:predicted RNase H-like HicB family nuclease